MSRVRYYGLGLPGGIEPGQYEAVARNPAAIDQGAIAGDVELRPPPITRTGNLVNETQRIPGNDQPVRVHSGRKHRSLPVINEVPAGEITPVRGILDDGGRFEESRAGPQSP